MNAASVKRRREMDEGKLLLPGKLSRLDVKLIAPSSTSYLQMRQLDENHWLKVHTSVEFLSRARLFLINAVIAIVVSCLRINTSDQSEADEERNKFARKERVCSAQRTLRKQ